MRKQMKKMVTSVMALSLMVVGIATGGMAYAAENTVGSAGALADSKYSLEEMLVYAIEDEYLAQAEYDVIMNKYGEVRPFSNIIKAEAKHINLLLPLFKEHDVKVVEKDWESMVSVPDSLEAAYAIGIKAEEKNIAMYESFLKNELPEDVKDVFERLMKASKNHLRAFQKAANGECTGSLENRNSNKSRQGRGQGNGQGRGQGNGQGQRNGANKANATGICPVL